LKEAITKEITKKTASSTAATATPPNKSCTGGGENCGPSPSTAGANRNAWPGYRKNGKSGKNR